MMGASKFTYACTLLSVYSSQNNHCHTHTHTHDDLENQSPPTDLQGLNLISTYKLAPAKLIPMFVLRCIYTVEVGLLLRSSENLLTLGGRMCSFRKIITIIIYIYTTALSTIRRENGNKTTLRYTSWRFPIEYMCIFRYTYDGSFFKP